MVPGGCCHLFPLRTAGGLPLRARMDFILQMLMDRTLDQTKISSAHSRGLFLPALSTDYSDHWSRDAWDLLQSLFAIQRKAADQAKLVAARVKLPRMAHRSGSARAALTM